MRASIVVIARSRAAATKQSRAARSAPGLLRFRLRAARFGGLQTRRSSRSERRRVARNDDVALRRDGGRRLAVEDQRAGFGADRHPLTVLDMAGQNLLGEWILHGLLDHALERTRAVSRIPTLVGEPLAGGGLD